MAGNDKKNTRGLSWRARFLREASSTYLSLIDVKKVEVPATRKRLDRVASMVPTAAGVHVEEKAFAGLKAEWLSPDESPDDKLLVYWHGGAYIMGSCASHRPVVSHISRAAGIRAVLPEYRLAPEHPFPAGLDDAVRFYRALLDDGFKPENIVVAGDSAGGGLSVAMMLALRHAGVPLPGAAVLLSPWLDLSGEGESMTTRDGQDPWFSPEDLPHVASYYCREDQFRDPMVSPVYANAAGLPPTLIQVGDDEILLSDSERLANSMRSAGCSVEIDVWKGMWHVWHMFIGLMPESKAAVTQLGEYIRGKVA